MRVLRRFAVVLSLVLMVGVTVGFFSWRSPSTEVRDEQLARAAEMAAARVDALVIASRVAATSASEPIAAVAGLREVAPSASVCVTWEAGQQCEGPLSSRITMLPASDQALRVAAQHDVVVVEVAGGEFDLRAAGRVESPSPDQGISVFATSIEPLDEPGTPGSYAGLRQTTATLASAPDVFVVASIEDPSGSPSDEPWLLAILGLLGIVLLGLTSAKYVVEQRALRERASLDSLTHLPNRGEFERRAGASLAEASRTKRPVCMLLLDLDGFKQINDTHGHHAGDQLLEIVAERLSSAVRDEDVVGRWGGDEFVVLMPGIESEEMAVRRARQIAESIAEPTWLSETLGWVSIHPSVGVALWPAHADDLRTLVAAADTAMYRAKREGSLTAISGSRPADHRDAGMVHPELAVDGSGGGSTPRDGASTLTG